MKNLSKLDSEEIILSDSKMKSIFGGLHYAECVMPDPELCVPTSCITVDVGPGELPPKPGHETWVSGTCTRIPLGGGCACIPDRYK